MIICLFGKKFHKKKYSLIFFRQRGLNLGVLFCFQIFSNRERYKTFNPCSMKIKTCIKSKIKLMSDIDFYGDNILALVFKVRIYKYGKKIFNLIVQLILLIWGINQGIRYYLVALIWVR